MGLGLNEHITKAKSRRESGSRTDMYMDLHILIMSLGE